MQFNQYQLTCSTSLALRPDGLYVCQCNLWGRPTLEVKILFEELLPLQLEEPAEVSRREVFGSVFGLTFSVFFIVNLLLGAPLAVLDVGLWGYSAGLGLGLLLVGWRHHRGRTTHLRTPRLLVRLGHRPRRGAQLRAFVGQLQTHTKAYLREEYGAVNPLGHIEPQLRRLAWLRELEVLSSGEARALTTRLTGQVPAAPLRSLGQELEGLFIN